MGTTIPQNEPPIRPRDIAVALFLGFLVCLLISLCSCKPTKEVETQVQVERVEVPVPIVQEHTTENVRVDLVRDTLYRHDSVSYYIKGDTVRIERWHYTTNNNVQLRVDTVQKVERVEVPVEVEKVVEKVKTVTKTEEVERPLSWWQKTKMGMGVAFIVLLGLALAFGSLRLYGKWKKL